MLASEIDRKLGQIARQSVDELTGWVYGLRISGRPMFDGEAAALIRRAKQIGATLPPLPKNDPPPYSGPEPHISPVLA